MTNFAEVFASVKDELAARYRSPIWGPAVFAFLAFHWKVLLFIALETPKASDAIAFVEANVTRGSVLSALATATAYVVLFPWVELVISWLAAAGTRSRNDFQVREREKQLSRRKVIALEEAKTIEIELKNKADQSRLTDTELAKTYQATLSGENFSRWLRDVEQGAINSALGNSIVDYLNKYDSVEGKFMNPGIERVHQRFVDAISTLNSTLNDYRSDANEAKRDELIKFARAAQLALQEYRQEVREQLQI